MMKCIDSPADISLTLCKTQPIKELTKVLSYLSGIDRNLQVDVTLLEEAVGEGSSTKGACQQVQVEEHTAGTAIGGGLGFSCLPESGHGNGR